MFHLVLANYVCNHKQPGRRQAATRLRPAGRADREPQLRPHDPLRPSAGGHSMSLFAWKTVEA